MALPKDAVLRFDNWLTATGDVPATTPETPPTSATYTFGTNSVEYIFDLVSPGGYPTQLRATLILDQSFNVIAHWSIEWEQLGHVNSYHDVLQRGRGWEGKFPANFPVPPGEIPTDTRFGDPFICGHYYDGTPVFPT